jgi:transcription-repair coupling factor (superfamily II helicase)
VQAGKQVAVLVPTTILAEQHGRTFRERLADYPVRIEVLSRFRSPQDTRRVTAAMATGELDIVIGTHRLLSRDVTFHDLGLLIVDEEHRFGVRHKERLKASTS